MLGDCGVSFLASKKLASKYRRGFPKSLDQAPCLLPLEGTALRRSLDEWFSKQRIRPVIRCEVGDRDLFEIQFGDGLWMLARLDDLVGVVSHDREV